MALLDTITERYQANLERIDGAIAQHRMSEYTITVTDAAGAPIVGQEIAIKQTRQAMRFGLNTFMFEGFKTEAENQAWQDAFLKICNSATIGSFWGHYEVEEGKYRFTADAEPMYRRPPIDSVLAWAKENDLTPRLHNLHWGMLQPSWRADDEAAFLKQVRRYIEALAERYADDFPDIDVFNEILAYGKAHNMRHRGYAPQVFQWARELFPTAKLFVNETCGHSWNAASREFSQFPLLIENLQFKGAPFDAIGMQNHLFGHLDKFADHGYTNCGLILEILDRIAGYGMPIDISEITIPTFLTSGIHDEQAQAELLRMLYRTWFSHPAVDAIIWWNLSDGNAFGDEAKWGGGLLREDLSPKPAYEVVDQLVNHEWMTTTTVTTDAEGIARFTGFHGRYEIAGSSVELGAQANEHTLQLKQAISA